MSVKAIQIGYTFLASKSKRGIGVPFHGAWSPNSVSAFLLTTPKGVANHHPLARLLYG